MKFRTLTSIALVCVATSYAKADESLADFFRTTGGPVASSLAPNIAASGVKAPPLASAARRVSGAGGTTRASWYGGGEHLARHTASGELFRPDALTAAHRSLPLGTRLLVSANGRSVIVRVNDRGPAASTGRSLDLSRGAARALGMLHSGTARVSYRVAGL